MVNIKNQCAPNAIPTIGLRRIHAEDFSATVVKGSSDYPSNSHMELSDQKYPLISVITVSLNATRFIGQTILSVLSQTYPRLEYIIIDGGSTDSTVDIIRKYESKLAYWHSKVDRGLAHAFNLGLEQAQGDWLLYLNADDYLVDSLVIENMVPYLIDATDADVVFGKIKLIPRCGSQSKCSERQIGHPWCWKEFRFKCTIPHQAAFTRKEYFDRVGPFSERLKIAVDYEHYLRAGPFLAARFIPRIISVMRDGGLGEESIFHTLKEWRIAQNLNRSSNPVLIGLNYLGRAVRFVIMNSYKSLGSAKKSI
jgi:glycosyltransferase involved in cell wall biosynthesis